MIKEPPLVINMDEVLKHYTLAIVRKAKKIIKIDESGVVYEATPEEYKKELEEKFNKLKNNHNL